MFHQVINQWNIHTNIINLDTKVQAIYYSICTLG